ncbi:inositol monophosphatase family protein [Terricaulis sp.]|uniref:inositol monophosphatase family protein n=1 Tax=Terricaulis sp. TaxID=2768686 RepID=UPI002AC4AFE6|nr:inositol monophosphatase family protein [Terricaulis sp.]MDZ4689794.1 inositol monophosphatase family protein [Terricaulis sp.]
MPQASATMNVMIAAARKAARALARDFGEIENLQVSRKGPSDFVTSADIKAEKTIFEDLSKARPGYGFVMEERGVVEGTDKTNRWIVDPLDGTTNFLHAIPHFAISIGLEREGVLVAGVVYNVVRDELFWAEKGAGAYLNDRRLRVAGRSDMRDALFATGTPFNGKPGHAKALGEIERVIAKTAGIRRFGSAALDLAYVAAGRFDGFWERGLNAWDIAAGAVIVREAGGVVTEIDGDDFMKTGAVLASNQALAPQLQQTVRGS